MNPRSYKNNVDLLEAGFRACWAGAQGLVTAAKVLLDNAHHAPALSLSVLALEELGKLVCWEGLLFARAGDHKAEAFAKSLKSHSTKLSALDLFPLLLTNIATVDFRYQREARFHRAIAIDISDLRERGKTIRSSLDGGTFHGLDGWKQSGFSSQPKGNNFLKPSEAVSREVADSVFMFAWRASTTLDFLLKDGNLERYMISARSLRSKLSEADHAAMSELAAKACSPLFTSDDSEVQNGSDH